MDRLAELGVHRETAKPWNSSITESDVSSGMLSAIVLNQLRLNRFSRIEFGFDLEALVGVSNPIYYPQTKRYYISMISTSERLG